jgi:flagellar basal body P-ring protein FlgI
MKTHLRPAVGLLAIALAALFSTSCSDTPEAIEKTPILRDTPSALRGTIGAEVTFRGIEPVVVSGLGLVVNLNNTGGRPLQDRILETMERTLALQGISSTTDMPGSPLHRKSPRDILKDPRTAVVIVQAAIPPGAPPGAKFDVYVNAVNATSLEGGQLWTTSLTIGETVLFGQAKTREIANARGPIFINPFATSDSAQAAFSQTTGRVLDGGWVTNPLQIEMVPDTASHSRVASMVSAINSRLPAGPGDSGATARGKTTSDINSGPSVILRVPRRFADRADEFLSIIKHLPINDSAPEMLAKRYTDALKTEPALANELAWCLEALDDKALPFTRGLYDYAEVVPRLAALRAGARLGDPMAAAPLIELASKGSGLEQLDAIALLAEIAGTPRIDLTLRNLLKEKELLVRIAAYEALAKRAEKVRLARLLDDSYESATSPLSDVSPMHREVIARAMFPTGMLQGIERRSVGGKFLLDMVPEGAPMIYVTQQGQPRIVIFGENPSLNNDAVVSAWNDRLLLSTDATQPGIRAMFREAETSSAQRLTTEGQSLAGLVVALAASSGPDQPSPGFNLTYSEVVGTLYAISSARATNATFATERDRLKASILAAGDTKIRRDRPETPNDPTNVVVIRRADAPDTTLLPTPDKEPPKIMPLPGTKGRNKSTD